MITKPICALLNALEYGPLASAIEVQEALIWARLASLIPTRSARFAYVDEYLSVWGWATEIENRIIGWLSKKAPTFEQHLTRCFRTDRREAMPRFIYYLVVQVGGAVSSNSPLGREALRELGPGFPTTSLDELGEAIFSAGAYKWWTQHRTAYPEFWLLHKWEDSDFAKGTAIPMLLQVDDDKKSVQPAGGAYVSPAAGDPSAHP